MHHLFLPTQAPILANVTLLAELAMAIALVFGAWLARRRQYRAHAWCQSSVVLLNLAVIAMAMAASFLNQVLPKIPARLTRPFYALATVHAVIASLAEACAIYILLAAGTHLLPAWLQLRNFKPAMRTVLCLWWLSLLLGVATYVRWYVPLH